MNLVLTQPSYSSSRAPCTHWWVFCSYREGEKSQLARDNVNVREMGNQYIGKTVNVKLLNCFFVHKATYGGAFIFQIAFDIDYETEKLLNKIMDAIDKL